VQRKLKEAGYDWDQTTGLSSLSALSSEQEKDLATKLSRYPEILETAATQFEPHLMTNYLKELASDFHTYYNSNKVLVEDESVRNGRVTICKAIQQVLANGLCLLGVSAPEEM
jgi:arginyl-tRNA synthetase